MRIRATWLALLLLLVVAAYYPKNWRTPDQVLLGALGRELRLPAPHGTTSFSTLPPGVALPSEADCAARVRRHPWEPRPQNRAANQRVPTAAELGAYRADSWNDPRSDALRRRVSGAFTGTTDELIQWAACKWGFDEDTVRAQAVKESNWEQAAAGDWEDGDCPPGYAGTCPHSFGLLQVRWNAGYGSRTTFPLARDATAFALDYALAVQRACYEGYETWLNDVDHVGIYGPGDEWGCLGRWFAGRWHTAAANSYIAAVEHHLTEKPWRQPGFARRWGLPSIR